MNSFLTDTEAEYEFIRNFCEERGCEFALSEVWAKGGDGGIELAKKVLNTLETKKSDFAPLYPDEMGISDKIETIAKEIYGAGSVSYSPAAKKAIAKITEMGFGDLPVCMAKTQYSLSDDQKNPVSPFLNHRSLHPRSDPDCRKPEHISCVLTNLQLPLSSSFPITRTGGNKKRPPASFLSLL